MITSFVNIFTKSVINLAQNSVIYYNGFDLIGNWINNTFVKSKKGNCMNDMGDFAKGFKTMSVEELFYRGDGDGDKNNIEGKYDKDGNPIGDTNKEPADGGAADGGGDKGGDATSPDPDSFGEGGTDNNNVVSVFNGKSFLEKMAARGIIDSIDNLDIMVDDKPVDLSTITREDDLLDIVEGLIKDKADELLKDKVDTGSMSEFMKKMIEVDKAGGNVGQLLNQYQNIQAPLDNLDMSNKNDQLAVIQHYYKMLGMPEDEIKDNMEMMIGKGDEFIESKANKFHDILKKEMDNLIEEEKKKSEKRKQELIEQMKIYKKGLKTSISSGFQLTDTMIGKAVDFVTKPIDNQGHTAIDKAYSEAIKNPDMAADLALFLMNKDEFLKQKTNKAKMEVNKKTITLLSGNKGGKQNKNNIDNDTIEANFLDLSGSKSV